MYKGLISLIHCLGFIFWKKFKDLWDSDVYLFTPGNEIGLVSQFWPNPVNHIKLATNRETDVLLSVRQDVSKKKTCLPDSTFSNFAECFKTKMQSFLLSKLFSGCQHLNTSICAMVQMKLFLEPGTDLSFCSTPEGFKYSTACFYEQIRSLILIHIRVPTS